MIIDAKDLIVGRIATVAAKKALLGEKIDIVNCQNAIMTGRKEVLFAHYFRRRRMGLHTKGPFFDRQPDRFVRRIIRGMLPYKQEKGKEAFKRIMCYNGIPAAFTGQKMEVIEAAHMKKIPTLHYLTIQEICRHLGGRQ